MSQTQALEEACFCGPTHLSHAEAGVEDSWWSKNRNRVAGLLRGVAHSMAMVSGAGYGAEASPWRVASGGLGLAGDGILAVFGEKKSPKDKNKPDKEGVIDRLRPAHVPRIYYSLLSLSSMSLIASGAKLGRKTELAAGLWSTLWTSIAAIAPEEKENAEPAFDIGKPTKSNALGFSGKLDKYYRDYKAHPKKLAADMLQFSAGFVLADGIYNRDYARVVAGVCLAASNFAGRTMRDDDYALATGRGK